MNDVVTIIVAELKPLRDALYLFIMFKTFKQWPNLLTALKYKQNVLQ